MNGWMIFIPILSTIAGWLISRISIGMLIYPFKSRIIFGIRLHGILPRHKNELLIQATDYLSKHLFSQKNFQEKFITKDQVESLLPQIEFHIDDFLRHRLGKKMPMISMFIGENTIRQLKEVFMEELKEIFPEVMTAWLADVGQQKKLGEAISQQINSAQIWELRQIVPQSVIDDLRYTGIIGALTGFMCGIIQLLLMVFAG